MAAIKHKKLMEWVGAGLLTGAQADAIHAYEEERKGGRFGRGLVGLSLFAILVGVLSIIASNWHAIPGEVKIGVHLLLNTAIGCLALWADRKGLDLWREGAALVFMGLTFTLIILIGQVFQLTGTPAAAMSFWFLITLPFFLLMGRGYMSAVPWILAFQGTIFLVLEEHVEILALEYQQFIAAGVGALLPLAFMGTGTMAISRKLRPALSDVALKMGIFLMVVQASMALAFWPKNFLGTVNQYMVLPQHGLIILGSGLAGIGLHAFLHRFYRDDAAMKSGALLTTVSLVSMIVPLIVSSGDSSIVPALAFIAYWMFIGWLAQGMHKMRIVSLAITIIAIRIFMIYVELFGSLMDTGVGLISGGIVMLGLIYGARKLNKRMTKGAGA